MRFALITILAYAVLPTFAEPAKQTEGAETAFRQFLADAKAKREEPVKKRLLVPPGPSGEHSRDQLIEAVNNGIFESFEIKALETKSQDDAAVVVTEVKTRDGRSTKISPFYLLRDGGEWKVLPAADPLKSFDTLTDAQKKQLEPLQTWYTKRKEELRKTAPPKADASLEAKRRLNTGLALAAAKGDGDEVERLIDAGADVNGDAFLLESPVKAAADRNQVEMVRLLAKHGASVNPPGNSLLPDVIEHGKVETLKALVELGADVNRSNDGDTPLGVAARFGKAGAVKILLDAKADPHPTRGMGGPFRKTTLLNLAAASGDLATFNLVRPVFPDLKVADAQGDTALHAVAEGFLLSEGKDHAAIVDVLLKAGLDPHAKSKRQLIGRDAGMDTSTPLRVAAMSIRPAALEALLDRVKYDKAELTLILPMTVTRFQTPQTVKKILDAGADPNTVSPKTGRTALHYAVAMSTPEVVELLLSRGADATIKDKLGNDAMSLAKIRAEKGREIVSRPGAYAPESEKTPGVGKKMIELFERRSKTTN